MSTPLEKLEAHLLGFESYADNACPQSIAMSLGDLRAIAKLARGTHDADVEAWRKRALVAERNIIQLESEKRSLETIYRVADEQRADRHEWKKKAEMLERERDELARALRGVEAECASQSGRAAAFFEALKMVCKVTP